ncbi:fibronectin type III domain-containing protein [bacterium]|nr:fibronectin type III domain-containing protein [bacterium]
MIRMSNLKTLKQRSGILFLIGCIVAVIASGCSDNTANNGDPVNPMSAYQPSSTSKGIPTNGQTQGIGVIDKPIVSVPQGNDGRKDHSNAPLLDNWHPGWQQGDCFGCHNSQSRIPDHSYSDLNLCYLCHGTNGLPGFGDNIPPVISGIVASPMGTTVKVSWETNEPTISRLILRSKDGDRFEFPASTDFSQSHGFTVEGLLPSTTYSYEIVTTDKNNNVTTTATFGVLNFTTQSSIGGPGGGGGGSQVFFTSISHDLKSSFEVVVKWTTAKTATSVLYIIRTTLPQLQHKFERSAATSFEVTDSLLTPPASYSYYIEAIDVESGKKYKSTPKTFSVSPQT